MNTETIELRKGDVVEELKKMRVSSVDLVVTDPPYFQIVQDEWDRQWKTVGEYQKWVERWAKELRRVLKKNGSLYVFTDERVGAYVQVVFDKYFRMLNNLVWNKGSGISCKSIMGSMRKYCITTERVLFYEQKNGGEYCKGIGELLSSDPECYTEIKAYLREEKEKAKIALGIQTDRGFYRWIGEETGKVEVCSHYFHRSQWMMPSEKAYRVMQRSGYFERPYEELWGEYEMERKAYYTGRGDELRGKLAEKKALVREKARVWNNDWKAVEVLNFATIYEGRIHPTQKPVGLLRYLIERSSRRGDVVLDCFAGSGSTLRACQMCGRRGIGIEKDETYYTLAREWLAREPEEDRRDYNSQQLLFETTKGECYGR